MMERTYTDFGIDEATFAAALRVIGHPWRPGQLVCACDHDYLMHRNGEVRGNVRCCAEDCVGCDFYHDEKPEPIPAVTDPLVMRMLREGLKQDIGFLDRVNKLKFGARHWCAGSLSADDRPSSCGFDENHKDHDFSYITPNTFEGAIIRATAALDKEG